MAMRGFGGLGWFLCGVVVAPTCYMVNSRGAADQSKLNSVKAAIVQAQKDIRGLETEFDTRANLAQLQRWNGDVLALAAPGPQQYLAGENALADLDKVGTAELQTASLVVPAGALSAQPVAPVVTASAAPVQPAPHAEPSVTGKSAAQQDRELRNLMNKADRKVVAMVDQKLLSASTMNDLEKLARREKQSLR